MNAALVKGWTYVLSEVGDLTIQETFRALHYSLLW